MKQLIARSTIFFIIFFALSIPATANEHTQTQNTQNVRTYSGVQCVTTTAIPLPEWKIQCGLFPLKQAIGLLMEQYIEPPNFTELAKTAFHAGAKHIDEFKYQEKNIEILDVPFVSVRGANENYVPDDWQMERLSFALLPLTQKLYAAYPATEVMGPRAFELLVKETRDIAIAAIIEKLHPHTDYYALGSEDRKNLLAGKAETQKGGGGFGGIGAALGYFGSVYIQMPFPNTPASRNLQRYDEIIAVDGAAVVNPGEVALKIRGDAGTSVALSIRRNGVTHNVTLIREIIKPQSTVGILYRINNVAICYIFITNFAEETDKEVDAIFAEGGPCTVADTFVLDLRSNRGGFANTAMKTAEKLLPKQTGGAGEETLLQFKSSKTLEQYFRDSGASLRQWKVRPIILQGPGSASGSELVIGILRPSATLIGERTFGKFSAYGEFILADGAVFAVTSSMFSFQDGIDYDGRGFLPDIQFSRSALKKEGEKKKIRREEHLTRYRGKVSEFTEEERLILFLGEYDPELAIAFGLIAHPERFFPVAPESKGEMR